MTFNYKELLEKLKNLPKAGKELFLCIGEIANDELGKAVYDILQPGLFPFGDYKDGEKYLNPDYSTFYALNKAIDIVQGIKKESARKKIISWIDKYANENFYKSSIEKRDDEETQITFKGELYELKIALNSFSRIVHFEKEFFIAGSKDNMPLFINYVSHYLDSSINYENSGTDIEFLIYLYETIDELNYLLDVSFLQEKIVVLARDDVGFSKAIEEFTNDKKNYLIAQKISSIVKAQDYLGAVDYLNELESSGNTTFSLVKKNFTKKFLSKNYKYTPHYQVIIKALPENTIDVDFSTIYKIQIKEIV